MRLIHLHPRRRSSVVFFIDSTEGNSVPLCSSLLMEFQRDLLHQQYWGSSEPPRSSPPPMAFRRGLLHRQHWRQQRIASLSPPPTVFRHGSLHRQQRSDTSPPRPSPLPMASRRFHQHRRHEEWYLTSSPISTADGFSALSSTLTPRGAIPHLLAGLHRRWLPGAFINIDATRSGASPPRPSTPPTASRHFHQH